MARLRAKWWNEIKPDKYRGSLSGCLEDYESALASANLAEVVEATDNLETSITKTRGDLERQLGRKSLVYKSIDKELGDLEKLVEKERKSVIARGVGSVLLFDKDIGKAISEAVKKRMDSKPVNITDFRVKLEIPLFVVQTLEYNGLQTEVRRKAENLTNDFILEVAELIFAVVRRSSGMSVNEKAKTDLRQEIDRMKSQFEVKLADIPQDTLRKANNNKIAAKMYKRDKAVSITKASLGVAASGAAMAAPGTQAVAIVGLVRSAAKLTEEIVALAMTVDAKAKSLLIQVNALNKAQEAGMKGKAEIAATTLNAVLGADAIPTIKSCKDRIKELDDALSMVADRTSKQELIIFEILGKSEKLEKSLGKVTVDRKIFKAAKITMLLALLRKRLDVVIKSMSTTMRRISDAEPYLPKLKTQFDKLTDNAKGVAIAVTVIPVAVNLSLSFGSAADGIVASTQAINIATNVLGVATDIESEVEGILKG